MAGNYRNSTPMRVVVDQQTPVPGPQTIQCNDLVNQAVRTDRWLFDPSTKNWYTPPEFKDLFGRITSGNEKFLKQIQVRDPMDGIQAGKLRVQDLQIKLDDFTRKVIDYYRKKR
jgi:hypothetical protein